MKVDLKESKENSKFELGWEFNKEKINLKGETLVKH
jgi:hypothetical protein